MSEPADRCLHCGSPVPAGAPAPGYCCRGCHAVHQLLVDEGLTRFYDLQTQRVPVASATHAHSFAWLEPLVAKAESADGAVCTLDLDVEGVHCAGCVWLMDQLFRRERGGVALTVNPALGKLRISWKRGALDLARFFAGIERFGYRFGADHKRRGTSDLPLRLGICAAITVNVMLFSFSFYVGLAPSDGFVFTLFSRLSLALSCVVVLVGGSVFFRSAWRGLRSGILHLDLPIAAGIALAFVASLVQARAGRGDRAYLDTLDVFVTLMLVGRWLQERVLERNRRFLLDDAGVRGLEVRRRHGAQLVTIDATRIERGDLLVLAPGDLLPVDAELVDDNASVTTDWITGEPEQRSFARGAVLPAGACNAQASTLTVVARTGFSESPLPRLLQAGGSSAGDGSHARLWRVLARGYVLGVLALSALMVAVWWPRDPARALELTVALLVVTCPCALGLAGPLAYQLVLARLRRHGFFVRNADVLDKLTRVRTLVFDKTGTLTLGRLKLVTPIDGLDPAVRDAAYNLAARSNHPVSRCLAEALAARGAQFDPNAEAHEVPGRGIERGALRLGAAAWAAPGHAGAGTVLARDGVPLARFVTVEELRPDARLELARLRAAGWDAWLLSGDAPARVAEVASRLGLPADRARGGLGPDDKAALVGAIDHGDTLYLGDGVNDSLAFTRALCAGTPALDRPVLPGKSDFFLLGDGLGAIGEALVQARRLRAVVRRNLIVSALYNALTVAACFAGVMTPVAAAVFMPLSSLSVLAWTATSLSDRRATRAQELAWTS